MMLSEMKATAEISRSGWWSTNASPRTSTLRQAKLWRRIKNPNAAKPNMLIASVLIGVLLDTSWIRLMRCWLGSSVSELFGILSEVVGLVVAMGVTAGVEAGV